MKDRKYLLFILPIMVFLGTFLVIRLLDSKSYAINSDTLNTSTIPDYAKFRYLSSTKSKNTYSHYIVDHNKGWAVGTKKLTYVDDNTISVVAYCAENGAKISTKEHTRYAINDGKLKTVDDETKTKLNKMMQYAYPYVPLGKTLSDNNTLKYYLNSIGGLDYTGLKFNDLTVQEAITAVQASIWNIIGKTDKYKYDSYKKNLNENNQTERQFNKCSGYYGNGSKILTSEEEQWYQDATTRYGDGCNSQGDFYKYVFQNSKSEDSKKRIDALINWYISTIQNNANVSNNTDTFEIDGSPVVRDVTSSSYTVVVTFKTNMTDYNVVFKDTSGRQLDSSVHIVHSGNVYTLSNVPISIKTIQIEAESNNPNKRVYWYSGSGQDFIGAENSSKNKFSVEINYVEQPGTVVLYKVTGASQEVEVVNGRRDNACGGTGQPTCLSGAKFVLYYGNKSYLKQNIIVQNGKFEVSNLIPGEYYLKEIEPAPGYDFYPYGQGAVDSEGYIKFTITDGNTVTVIVNNQPTNICIKKVSNDAPNEVLEGAKLIIEDEDGQVFESFTSSKQDGSGSNGTHCVSKLPVGSYYITETEAPAGFSLPAKATEFNVGKVNNVATSLVTVTNRKGLTMSKSDLTDGECVTGALLVIKNSSGQEVTRWTSTCSGNDEEGEDSHTVPICLNDAEQQALGTDCLKPGKYTLTEQIHPEGYATAETIEFEIDSNGKVIGDTNMKDAPIEVCIYKVKKGTEEVLTGAEFDIYAKKTNLAWSIENHVEYNEDGSTVMSSCHLPIGDFLAPFAQDDNFYYQENEECISNKDVLYENGNREKLIDALVSRHVTIDAVIAKGFSINKREKNEENIEKYSNLTIPNIVNGISDDLTYYTSIVSSKEPCIPYFPVGEYVIKETKAPDGYALPENNETTITVKDKAGHQNFYIENEIIIEKTAMDYSVTVVIIASVFLMFGIGLVGYYEYKKGH